MVELFSISENFVQDLVKSTVALLVVIDPLGLVPIFISLTQKMERKERTAVSKTIIITATALLFAFALAGNQIFRLFGITISSFMIAGGILLFIVAVGLLTRGEWKLSDSALKEEVGVVPLAFPLLAGPGAITSVIISFETSGLIVTTVAILIAIGTTYLVLSNSGRIYKILGLRGTMIVTRVFAVLVAAIAVQFIIEGVKGVFT